MVECRSSLTIPLIGSYVGFPSFLNKDRFPMVSEGIMAKWRTLCVTKVAPHLGAAAAIRESCVPKRMPQPRDSQPFWKEHTVHPAFA